MIGQGGLTYSDVEDAYLSGRVDFQNWYDEWFTMFMLPMGVALMAMNYEALMSMPPEVLQQIDPGLLAKYKEVMQKVLGRKEGKENANYMDGWNGRDNNANMEAEADEYSGTGERPTNI